jgi:hypothetical protein
MLMEYACRIQLKLILGLTIWQTGMDALAPSRSVAVAADMIPAHRMEVLARRRRWPRSRHRFERQM